MGLTRKKKIVVSHNTHNLMGAFENRQKFLPAIITKGVLGQRELGSHIIGEYTNGLGLKYRRIPKQAVRKGLMSFLQPVPFEITSFNHDLFIDQLNNYFTNTYAGSVQQVEIIIADTELLDEYDWGFYHLCQDPSKHYLIDYEFQVNYNDATSILEYSFIDPVSDTQYHPDVFIPVPPLSLGVQGIFVVYRLTRNSSPPLEVQINAESGTSSSTYPYPSSDFITDFSNIVTEYDASNGVFTQTIPWYTDKVEFNGGDVINGMTQPTFGYYEDKLIEVLQYPNVEPDPTKPPKMGNFNSMISWSFTHTRIYTYGYEVEYPLCLCYPVGSGNTQLDNIYNASTNIVSSTSENWFPVFPLRIDNQLAKNLIPQQYKICYRLTKKLGLKLKKIMKQYQEHDEWDKMSYIFVRFGVGINGHNKNRSDIAKYLYKFFFSLGIMNGTDNASKVIAYNNALALYKAQMEDRKNNPENYVGVPLPTPPAPLGAGLIRSFEQKYTRPNLGFDIRYTYQSLTHKVGIGKYRPELKARSYRVFFGTHTPAPDPNSSDIPGTRPFPLWVNLIRKGLADRHSFIIVHQVTDTFYESLEISGLEEKVFVFKGKYALNQAVQNQQDDTIGKPYFGQARDSDLIIPILPSILKDCGMVSYTQIALEGVWGSIHTYQKIKVKRGAFKWLIKIIAIVIIIVVSYFDYTGSTQSAVASAVATIGASVAVSVILTVIVKIAIAAIITAILNKVATKLFGAKWGGIIASIAAMVLMTYSGTGSFNLAQFSTAPNLLALSSAVAQGYGEHYRLKSEQLMEEMKEYSKESKERWDEIYTRMYEETSTIDSRTMLEIMRRVSDFESHDSFLERTLMTGSDVAEATVESISSFVDSTLIYPT